MKKIFKYELGREGRTVSYIDRFAEILHLGDQGLAGPQMWALVDDDVRLKEIEIRCVGTGWPILFDVDNYEYIGSVIEDTGLVWHYYMREKEIVEQVVAMRIPAILKKMASEAEVAVACAA